MSGSNYSSYLMNKQKAKLDAAFARPEKPNFSEQANLNRNLFEMGSKMPKESDATLQMFDDLEKSWKSPSKGGPGDAFFAGVKSGIKKGSILEDKNRLQRHLDIQEQLQAMVDQQNRQLYKYQQFHTAQEATLPRFAAYLENYKNMSPDSRMVYLQRAFDEFNELAGTNLKATGVDGKEPWKVMATNDGETDMLDIIDFIKTPQQKKAELYFNSDESRQLENQLKAADAREQSYRNEDLRYKQARADALERENPANLSQKRAQMESAGVLPKGAMLFDEIVNDAEKRARIDDLRIEKEKLPMVEAGITALNEMENIFKEYPKISTSLAKWANSKEDTLLGNTFKNWVNQDERDALLQLEKHAAALALGTIQQFKGQRPTDILKRLIKETNPGSNFTLGAFKPIKEQYMRQFERERNKAIEANKGWNTRYFPTYDNLNNSVSKPPEAIVSEVRSKNPGFKDFTDQQVLEWATKRGGYELSR